MKLKDNHIRCVDKRLEEDRHGIIECNFYSIPLPKK
jgi:hypothetical protein